MCLVPGRAIDHDPVRRRPECVRRTFSRNEKYRRSNAVPDPPSRRTASSFGAKAARVRTRRGSSAQLWLATHEREQQDGRGACRRAPRHTSG